jgi:serine/threonine protein kinase
MALSVGTRLGPYEIVAPLGAGGMGEVYRARDTRLDRTVAIKVLPEHTAGDPQRRERFEREARSASALNHPNILSVFDVGRDRDADYLVTELVDGVTLRERIGSHALPARDVVAAGAQIADGLDAAHAAELVHRDPLCDRPHRFPSAQRGLPPARRGSSRPANTPRASPQAADTPLLRAPS